MNRWSVILYCTLLSQPVLAHHTKDHMMLAEEAGQVIAATREGSGGGWVWLAWAAVTLILLLGFVRWWNKKA
ncbi:hypothetical protein MNBD_GAMMA14-963 [hydrothermal vent metagenome]|uniref:Uncharacterized protein n=1 Tax=hydrothermal vent metagenome TaxID=652676 RepID=A0A3B0Y783_9ZZZZ